MGFKDVFKRGSKRLGQKIGEGASSAGRDIKGNIAEGRSERKQLRAARHEGALRGAREGARIAEKRKLTNPAPQSSGFSFFGADPSDAIFGSSPKRRKKSTRKKTARKIKSRKKGRSVTINF